MTEEDATETLNGSQIVVRLLERQGVRRVAGIPGGSILPFYDALSQSKLIRHVLARHEQGAGFIAHGAARATGETAVCLATSGPGVTNLLTAIADAKLDSIPLVAITGQVPTAMIGSDAFQEVDTYGLSIPITKHNFLVCSAAELLEVIPEAFRLAASGRPGPVLVDIPKDVQNERIEVTRWPEAGRRTPAPEADSEAIARAVSLIDAAERSILYLGGGVTHSDGAALAVELAEKGGLPTVMTLMALGTMPVDHALSLGLLGMHAARCTNMALEECDLLIAVGARFDDRATGKATAFCPRAKIIHIDIDRAELDKIKTAHVGIHGDLGDVLGRVLPQIRRQSRARWLARVGELKAGFPLRTPGVDDLRTPYGLIRAVADNLTDEAIVATDVGQHQMWVAQTYPLRRPRQWLTSGGLGTMGFGLPTAIGAAMAQPERTVVCFSGDGSILMNIQELATAAEEGVNVKLVLMNNASLGLVAQQQNLFYGGRVFSSRFAVEPDFLRIAEGFGWRTLDLDSANNPREALGEALSSRGPVFIHARIDRSEQVLPMVVPSGANKDMIGD
ncbi:MAG: acetolactate synthase large subunit [Candidatus Accumulibacter sp.]|jgi:acetolactate synthase-1/2/3 large subunit|nr:acetolactate synthase large subunit [Accumulibacter sp.]